jgi:hypothetical protein
MWASHKVLVEVDDNEQLIIGDQQGILVQQLKTHPIHIINIIVITVILVSF